MRALFVIAVTAILITAFGSTLFSFARPIAPGIADSGEGTGRDVAQPLGAAELPMQTIHDMSVVFS
jgi:hypothetical protein